MKYSKYILMMALSAGLLTTATSCKDDWSLIDAPSAEHQSASNTLWENIQLDKNLTQFADLVKKAGFDTQLSSANYYTVWAPENGTFDYESLKNLDAKVLENNFVKNHVAQFAHNLSGNVNEKIGVLNEKFYVMSSETNSFDDANIVEPNIPSRNGIMHKIGSEVPFRYSLYEMFDQLGENYSNFVDYYKKYETKTLNIEKSTKGPIVDGEQTYLDEVYDLDNRMLFNNYRAKINNEDSTYTMLVPTNEAWNTMYDIAKKLYVYNTADRNTIPYNYNDAGTLKATSATFNYDYVTDSLATYSWATNLFYNNHEEYNDFLINPENENNDTIFSTRRSRFYDASTLTLARQIGEPEKCSNGYVRYLDSIAFHPWQTYSPNISVYPYGSSLLRNTQTNSYQRQVNIEDFPETMEWPDTAYNSFNYVLFEKSSDAAKPEVDIYLPGVQARKYHIYAVIVPAALEDPTGTHKPNVLKFDLYYCNAKGKIESKTLLAQTTAKGCDPEKIDTLDLGEFEFPVSYRGSDAAPDLRITTVPNFVLPANRTKYEQSLRIAAVMLRTPEYEAYIEERKK